MLLKKVPKLLAIVANKLLVLSVHLYSSLERLVPVFNVKQKFYSYCTQTMCGFKINYIQMPLHN